MKQNLDFSLLKTLTGLAGVSGREEAVRTYLKQYLAGRVDQMREDALGNLIVTRKGVSTQSILLCAHMDEVGLMVNYIDPRGFLRFITVGGIDPRTLLAQRVRVQTKTGELFGVIGTKPAHITTEADRAKAVSLKELFIDVGLPAAQVKQRVSIGDVAVLDRPYMEFGDGFICAKSLDNRAGVFVLAELMRCVDNPKHTLHAVFSTQEEVGLRGATTAAYGLQPAACFVLDTTGAADIPCVNPQDQIVQLGGGVGITALDARTITPQAFFEQLVARCQQQDIPFQVRIAPRGGTDAGAVHLSKTGVTCCSLSIPTRNIHSNVEVICKKDVQAMFDLVFHFLKEPRI